MSFERGFEPPFPDPEDVSGNYLGEENPFDDDYWDDDYDTNDIFVDAPFYETVDGVRVPLSHDESMALEAKAEMIESDDPDDNPYGIVYDQRGKRDATTTHEVLSDAAYNIGDAKTWQFLGIKGNNDQDIFRVDVVSKDAIPQLAPEDFGDIAECVAINTESTDAEKKMQALIFNGTRAQMDDFIVYLREKFAFPVDEDADPLRQLKIPVPLLMLASMLGGKSIE